MTRQLQWAALGLAVFGTGLLQAEEAEKDAERNAEAVKTVEHELRELKLTVPETWTFIEPSNQFRVGSFAIPAAEGDEDPSELVVTTFAGGGGGARANIERWIGQFEAEGREVKVVIGESPQGPYVLVDITGTYNMSVGPPIRMQSKKVPEARLLAAIVSVNDESENYFLKLGGPHKTIDAAADAFRASFGADKETEKDVEVREE